MSLKDCKGLKDGENRGECTQNWLPILHLFQPCHGQVCSCIRQWIPVTCLEEIETTMLTQKCPATELCGAQSPTTLKTHARYPGKDISMTGKHTVTIAQRTSNWQCVLHLHAEGLLAHLHCLQAGACAARQPLQACACAWDWRWISPWGCPWASCASWWCRPPRRGWRRSSSAPPCRHPPPLLPVCPAPIPSATMHQALRACVLVHVKMALAKCCGACGMH